MAEISIIVPVYKAEQYLNTCIDPILAQRFKDFELILVDDGSPDNCGKICDDYAAKDSRVKIIHKANAGVSAARNSGIDVSCGKYIMFCDSDDYVDRNWCSCLYDAIKNKEADMAVCGFKSFSYESSLVSSGEFKTEHLLEKKDLSNLWWIGSCWNKIYNAFVIKLNRLYYDTSIFYAEDLLFNSEYILNCKNFNAVFIAEKPYNYRVAVSNSLTQKYIPDLWNIEKRVIDQVETVIYKLTNDPEFDLEDRNSGIIDRVITCLTNVFCKPNNLSVREKYRACKEIIRSDTCKQAFQYGDFCKRDNNFKYKYCVVPVLKTRSAFIITTFYLLLNRFSKNK